MDYITSANTAGRSTPTNDEAHSTPHAAGLKDQNTLYPNPTVKLVPPQAPAEEINLFAQIARQFTAAGLSLYPFDGTSVLVTAPKLGMSRVLPDLRTARLYLREIGGAA